MDEKINYCVLLCNELWDTRQLLRVTEVKRQEPFVNLRGLLEVVS